jgi:hypothetical protein
VARLTTRRSLVSPQATDLEKVTGVTGVTGFRGILCQGIVLVFYECYTSFLFFILIELN